MSSRMILAGKTNKHPGVQALPGPTSKEVVTDVSKITSIIESFFRKTSVVAPEENLLVSSLWYSIRRN